MDTEAREVESLSYDEPLPTPFEALMRTIEVHLRGDRKPNAIRAIETADLEAIFRKPEDAPIAEPTEAVFFATFLEAPRAKNERIAKTLRCRVELVVKMRKAFQATRHQQRLEHARQQARQLRQETNRRAR